MKDTYSILKIPTIEKNKEDKYVSYSQYSKWKTCPRAWKLAQIDRIRKYDSSIHAVFGTAIHACMQYWIKTMYLETIKKAETIDFPTLLMSELKKAYQEEYERAGTHFSNKEELSEFYLDGLNILEWTRKKRKMYFDRKNEELVGIEIPILLAPDPKLPGVILMGYLDLVTKDKRDGKYLIRDIKTSTRGWKDWDKKDETKVSQLLLYKIYFSQQYNIPADKIQVEYFIVRRKIDEDAAYPQRRVQNFAPAQGSVSINKVQRNFNEFLESCFLPEGGYNLNGQYEPMAGLNFKNCRFCEYNNEEHCPQANRRCQ